jgi:hypothetical protein
MHCNKKRLKKARALRECPAASGNNHQGGFHAFAVYVNTHVHSRSLKSETIVLTPQTGETV